ncbi:hypothetical protein ACKLNQ_02600 [Myroides odoratimimus]|uniref:hypothetical protein n=1 Tax=Myroides odoratimimus TaxID=76832 RepID=UPI0038D404DA
MNITRIFYFIITVALGVVFYTQYQLSTRLENLNNSIQNLYLSNNKELQQINNLIFESHFKDDLILNNFNTSTTIIIAFFTALIALAGVFSFKKIDEDIKELKKLKQEVEKANTEIKNTYNKSIIRDILGSKKIIRGKLIKFKEAHKICKHDIYFITQAFNEIITSYYKLKNNTINNIINTDSNLKTISLDSVISATLKFSEDIKPIINEIKPFLKDEHKKSIKKNLLVIDEIPVEIINQFKEIGKLLTDEDIDITTEY